MVRRLLSGVRAFLSKHQFARQPLRQTRINGLSADSDFCRPVAQRHCPPEPRKATVGAGVSGLCRGVSPSHVSGLVVTVVVDAIKRVAPRRSAADIFKESNEAGAPFLADGNTSGAIARPSLIARILTAHLHHGPDGVLGNRLSVASHPVSRGPLSNRFPRAIEALRRCSRAQMSRVDTGGSAAIAPAAPTTVSALSGGGLLYDGPPTNAATSKKHI